MKFLLGVSLIANAYLLRSLLKKETKETQASSANVAFAAYQLAHDAGTVASDSAEIEHDPTAPLHDWRKSLIGSTNS